MADVDITIRTIDETEQATDSAANNLGKMKKSADEAGDKMKGYASKIDDVVKELTGFSIAQISAAGAIAGMVKMARDAIGEYSTYVEQIDKMSMATGLASEEMSRLVQLADDFRVDTGALENALKMALQNGFNPSVDSLADLADKIKTIHDPARRAEELTKIFGRSWQDILPLLERGGDEIRAAADGISDSLIVTKDAIETNRLYQESVDNLSDAWMGFKFAITKDILPALAELLAANARSIEEAENGATRLEVIANRQAEAAEKAQNAMKPKTIQDWANILDEAGLTVQETAGQIDDLTVEVEGYADALKAAQDAQSALWSAQESYRAGIGQDLVGLLKDAGIEGQEYKDALAAIDEKQGTNFATTERMNEEMAKLVDQYKKTGDLAAFAEGVDNLSDSFEPFNKKVREAETDLARLQLALDALDGRQVNIGITLEQNGYVPTVPGVSTPKPSSNKDNYVEKEAAGGNIHAGETVLVGEFGPELFRPSMGGTIAPTNAELQGKTQTASLNQYSVQIFVTSTDPRAAAQEIEAILGDQARMASIAGAQYMGS